MAQESYARFQSAREAQMKYPPKRRASTGWGLSWVVAAAAVGVEGVAVAVVVVASAAVVGVVEVMAEGLTRY